MHAARSGYLEVSRRLSWADSTNESRAAAYHQIPCERASERYERFLRAILAGEPLGPELFHAYPQALKLSAVTRIDRLLQLEDWQSGEQAHILLRE